MQTRQPQSLAGLSPVSDHEPSTSIALPPMSSAQVPPDKSVPAAFSTVRPWPPDLIRACPDQQGTMREVRRLVRKRERTPQDIGKLIVFAETLAGFAMKHQTCPVSHKRPYYATRQLAVRFLTISLLYEALQIIGENREWWPTLLRVIPTEYAAPAKSRLGIIRGSHALAQELSAALTLYKTGSRPSDEQIRNITYELFFSPYGPQCFKEREWDFWREGEQP